LLDSIYTEASKSYPNFSIPQAAEIRNSAMNDKSNYDQQKTTTHQQRKEAMTKDYLCYCWKSLQHRRRQGV